jgi:imidazolonepropionase-like amidohydrolase
MGLKLGRRVVVAVMLTALASACARHEPPLVTRPEAPPPATLIRGVAIFDGLAAARTPPRDVLIEGGRVTRIAAAGAIVAPEGAAVIEGEGDTLLPGLIDVHGHVGNSPAPLWAGELPDPEHNLQSYLYAGVTTVFDPADLAPAAFERRAAVAEGSLIGPTIFAAGPMFTTPGGHPVALLRLMAPWWIRWYLIPRATREVATPHEASAAVVALLAYNPDAIKVGVDAIPEGAPIIAPDVLRAIVETARSHHVRTVAHIGTVADALEAADAGVAAWMHGVYKERIPDDVLPRFVAAKIPYVATIVVFDSYADVVEGKRVATALERESVRPEVLASFAPVPSSFAPAPMVAFSRMLVATREARCENVRRVHAAGITVLAGSDAQSGVFPGPGLHRELALLVRCGLTPAEALRAATGDAARFIADDPDPHFGVIAEGKVADLVLVEGDPTTDIGATERIREVFRHGIRLERHPVTAPAAGT